MVINDPCVLYEGCWDSHLDSKLSTSFFPFVVVVSIFSNNDHCNGWDSSRCFHALCETKTWCILSGSTWGVAGLTFHYSWNACWNWMCDGIWTRLQREHLVWKDWRREGNLAVDCRKSSSPVSVVEGPKNADLPKVCVMLLHLILAFIISVMPSCAFPAGLVGKNIPVPVYTVKWRLLHRPHKRHPNCCVSTLWMYDLWELCSFEYLLMRFCWHFLRINFGMAFSYLVL